MEIKICSRCNKPTDLEDMAKKGRRSSGKLMYRTYCSSCDGTDKKKQAQKRLKIKAMLKKLGEYKEGLSCTDCGLTFVGRPWVCDFHHLDPTTKKEGVSILVRGWSWDRVLEEIKKCTPLCSNCHRTRHHLQK
jgi:hypothetical protein